MESEKKINDNSIEIINGVIKYIEDNLESHLDLDTISSKAGYSKFHLIRMFSDKVGCTIHQYIIRRRITEAARKLIFSDKAIEDIAYESGYDSKQSFISSFKKLYFITPNAYRNNDNFYPIELCFAIDTSESHKYDDDNEMIAS